MRQEDANAAACRLAFLEQNPDAGQSARTGLKCPDSPATVANHQ
jgi:hypothetical protein